MDELKFWQMIDFLLICTVFQCHNNNKRKYLLALGDSIKTHSVTRNDTETKTISYFSGLAQFCQWVGHVSDFQNKRFQQK